MYYTEEGKKITVLRYKSRVFYDQRQIHQYNASFWIIVAQVTQYLILIKLFEKVKNENFKKVQGSVDGGVDGVGSSSFWFTSI